jgi:peptidoglycan/LPS O-acetylase OafA/YrhL
MEQHEARDRPTSQPRQMVSGRVVWPDALRITAAISIFVFHFLEVLPKSATPLAADWIPGTFGLAAVSLFVMLSGFTAGLVSARPIRSSYVVGLRTRFERLLIPYWTVAVPLIVVALAIGVMPRADAWKIPFWLTGLNILGPRLYEPLSESWWYVTLALQMAIISPFLPPVRRRIGVIGLAFLSLAINATALLVIGMLPKAWGYLTQGLVFARLAELTIGFVLGAALFGNEDGRPDSRTLAAVAMMAIGGALMYDIGMYTFPLGIIGAAGLVTLCSALLGPKRSVGKVAEVMAALGALSYVFYLSHTFVVRLVVEYAKPDSTGSALVWMLVAFALALPVAWAFDKTARRLSSARQTAVARRDSGGNVRQST